MRLQPFLILIVCANFLIVKCRAQSGINGWLFLSHKQKVTQKISFLTDVQVRSAAKLSYISTLLLRGAVNYEFNKKNSFALGYANKGDWEKTNGKYEHENENRIFEQYLLELKPAKVEWTGRLRWEQRFTMEEKIYKFSQRMRGLVAAQIPVKMNQEFKKGFYFNLQNEIFLNIQHKDVINNHFFDQNRSYGSFGHRWSEKFEAEIGYMYWRQQEQQGSTGTHVLQVMVNTSL